MFLTLITIHQATNEMSAEVVRNADDYVACQVCLSGRRRRIGNEIGCFHVLNDRSATPSLKFSQSAHMTSEGACP